MAGRYVDVWDLVYLEPFFNELTNKLDDRTVLVERSYTPYSEEYVAKRAAEIGEHLYVTENQEYDC